MAHINLVVGVDHKASLEEFQKGIESLVKSVNDDPPKIKVDIDTNGVDISKLTKQIKAIHKSASQGSGGSSSASKKVFEEMANSAASAASSAEEAAEEMDALQEGSKAYADTLTKINNLLKQRNKELRNAQSSGKAKTFTDDIQSDISSLEQLKKTLLDGSLTVEDFATDFSNIKSVISETALAIDKSLSSVKFEVGSPKQQKALADISKLKTRVSDATKWTAADSGRTSDDFAELQKINQALNKLKYEVSNGTVSIANYEKRLSSLSSRYTSASERIKLFQKDTALLTSDTEEYSKSLIGVNNAISKYTKLLEESRLNGTAGQSITATDQFGATFDTTFGESLESIINRLNTLKDGLASGKLTANEFASSFKSIEGAASEASLAMTRLSTVSDTTIQVDTDEYIDAMNDLITVKKMIDEASGWEVAATDIRTFDAYNSLDDHQKELDNLLKSLVDGELTVSEFKSQYSSLVDKVTSSRQKIQKAGNDHASSVQKVANSWKKFLTWFSASQVIMQGVQTLKKMVSTVVELDTAMTELKKVTDETDAVYDQFLIDAAGRAKKLGSALSDVVTATAGFARLGYSISESEDLADAAIVYKNVGDGITDINEATESVIATMQAFGISANDAMGIVDRFNLIGNRFAITSGGVGDALLRSAAAMHSANNTLDETIALVTAANTIVQNPESVGTTLKTMSMYLRASKTEAEEAGESTDGMANSVGELRNEILKLTGNAVDIQINENTFKSTYQILKELSGVWHSLTDVSQANILEMIGGKRNANVVSAILDNFSIAEEALKTSANSAGSALEENEKYLDSINGRVSILKASFENLSSTVVDSEIVKSTVDFGTSLIDGADSVAKITNRFGGFKTVLALTLSVLAALKADYIVLSMLLAKDKIGKTINNIKQSVASIGTTFKSARLSAVNFFSASVTAAGLAVAAITLVASAITAVRQKEEEARSQAISAGQEIASEADEVFSLASQYIELNKAVDDGKNVGEEFYNTRDSLIEKLGLERYELQKLTEEWGSYEEAVSRALINNATKNAPALVDALEAAEKDLMDVSKKYSNAIAINMDIDTAESNAAALDALERNSMVSVLLNTDANIDRGIRSTGIAFDIDTSTAEGMVDLYEQLGEVMRYVSEAAGYENSVYKSLNDQYAAMGEAVGAYDNALANLNQNKAESLYFDALIGKEIPSTKKEFDEFRSSLVEGAIASKEFAGGEDTITNAIDSMLSKQSQFSKFYEATSNSTSSGLHKQSEAVTDLSTSLSSLKSAYELLATAESEMASGGLTASTINSIAEAEENYLNYLYEENGAIKLNVELWKERSNLEANSNISAIEEEIGRLELERDRIESAITKLLSSSASSNANLRGVSPEYQAKIPIYEQNQIDELTADLDKNTKAIDENQNKLALYKELYDGVTASASDSADRTAMFLYTEAGAIQMTTDAWVAQSKAVEAASKSKIEALELELAFLRAQKQELSNGSNPAGNADRLNDIADQIASLEHTIGVYKAGIAEAAHATDDYASAISEFADTSSLISQVSESLTTVADLQERVANGFTLSIDEALKFAEVYPEILNSATVTADGQIRLNNKVVNSLIDGAEAEYRAQLDAKIAELEADKEVLVAKKAFAEAQLSLSKTVSEGNINITTEEAQYRVRAGNAVVEALIEAGVDEATAHGLAAASMSRNYSEFNRICMEVCRDVEGNFDEAAYCMASSIYKNVVNSKVSLSELTKQAHEAGKAIAAAGAGRVEGSSSIIDNGGSGGTRLNNGNFSTTTGDFNTDTFQYVPKELNLDDFISNVELDITEYTNAISQIDGQIAILQAMKKAGLEEFRSDLSSSSGGSSGSSDVTGGDNWFEQQYKLHNHLRNMEQEEDEDYFTWLNTAYKQAYDEGIISLDDYRKYAEEVYEGLRNLFLDYLNDVEHEISMREHYEGETNKIISLYEELMGAVEAEIAAARKNGLDDTDDYIQQLQSKWWSYNDALEDIRNSAKDSAKDSLDELVEIRVDMLKEDLEKEKEALNDKLDLLKDFYDRMKDILQDYYDEEKYLEEQSEKRKQVSDIEAELSQLQYDDSAWAQKRKLELAEELAEAEKDLLDFEKEHALDAALSDLDEMYESQAKDLEKKTDEIDSALNDEKALYEQALEDIRNGSVELYEEMLSWNSVYGTGIDEDITTAWENAYVALKNYHDLFGELYKDIDLFNATGFSPSTNSWDSSAISDTGKTGGMSGLGSQYVDTTTTTSTNTSTSNNTPNANTSDPKPSLSNGSTITVKSTATNYSAKSGNAKMASFVPGGKFTIYKVDGNEVLIGLNGAYTGWINKSDIVGYAKGTRDATAGLHIIDELGEETIFESANGTRYKMFSGGEKVLNAKASNFLYDFATSGGHVLTSMLGKTIDSSLFSRIGGKNISADIKMGDIIVNGNADQKTVSEIRRAQRDSIDFILREFSHLNK